MRFVLIGGGENGHGSTSYETAPFDTEIVRLAEQKTPHFLFIGAANQNPDGYYEVMRSIYGGMYGCVTDHLTTDELKQYEAAQCKLRWADIIYVGGGDTLHMMKLFRRYQTDVLLKQAAEQNKVLCGVSAGAICWCRYGQSGIERQKRVTGLGLVDLLFCPHPVTQPQRNVLLQGILQTTYRIPGVAVDRAAIEIVEDRYRVLFLEQRSKAEKCFYRKGNYITKDIKSSEWKPLSDLLQKQ